jgi:predicted phosphohydrolase
MSLFVMADLHLSSDRSKAMDIFGARWQDHMKKIEKNWNAVVSPEDTVIIPGDISWSLKLEDSLDDFRFLDSLNGQKLIGKGNHDFWWSTHSKLRAFWETNGIKSINILYNNAHRFDNCIVCGTRGWFVEESQQHTIGEVEYAKIVNREAMRLKMSLEDGMRLKKEALERGETSEKETLVFLHFPPVFTDFICREIIDVLHEYGIKNCFYGHVHGNYFMPRTVEFEGIDFIMTASDFLSFAPMPIHPDF